MRIDALPAAPCFNRTDLNPELTPSVERYRRALARRRQHGGEVQKSPASRRAWTLAWGVAELAASYHAQRVVVVALGRTELLQRGRLPHRPSPRQPALR